jgi:lipopolysaccharide export system protein LptA
MICFRRNLFLFVILPFLSLIVPRPSSAESVEKISEPNKDSQIVIKADSLEIDDQNKVVIFTGNVDAREKEFVINCQKMVLYYKDQSARPVSETGQVNIDRIIATGGVKITRPNGGLATAEKALYYRNDEKLVLTGKPKVKQGDDYVQGSKITLFLKENRSVVEGSKDDKVRAVYSPRNEKEGPVDR